MASLKRNETLPDSADGAKLFLMLQKHTPSTPVFERIFKQNKIKAWARKVR